MQNYIESFSVSYPAAARAVSLAIEEGAKRGVAVAVTVVDPTMGLIAFGRADGSMPHSVETSRRKANTAASSRRPTGWMQGDFALTLPMGTDNLLTNIRGGFPVVLNGKHVGGLGVAGGTPDQDAEIGLAVLDMLSNAIATT
ncbi:heme-binding protein [Arthrobacter sp. HS15c]|uniref:GlcG/HbpS family heme-binding protein n=1 Tax=Arthrobacter sp. HS15c TaxID=3230279 RepID=UPI003465364B